MGLIISSGPSIPWGPFPPHQFFPRIDHGQPHTLLFIGREVPRYRLRSLQSWFCWFGCLLKTRGFFRGCFFHAAKKTRVFHVKNGVWFLLKEISRIWYWNNPSIFLGFVETSTPPFCSGNSIQGGIDWYALTHMNSSEWFPHISQLLRPSDKMSKVIGTKEQIPRKLTEPFAQYKFKLAYIYCTSQVTIFINGSRGRLSKPFQFPATSCFLFQDHTLELAMRPWKYAIQKEKLSLKQPFQALLLMVQKPIKQVGWTKMVVKMVDKLPFRQDVWTINRFVGSNVVLILLLMVQKSGRLTTGDVKHLKRNGISQLPTSTG